MNLEALEKLAATFRDVQKQVDYLNQALTRGFGTWDWKKLGEDITEMHRIVVQHELEEEFGA